MPIRPLYEDDYRPKFSGHETFSSSLWMVKKSFDRVESSEDKPENNQICWGEDAIAHFGVGKNMVSAIRHWAINVG